MIQWTLFLRKRYLKGRVEGVATVLPHPSATLFLLDHSRVSMVLSWWRVLDTEIWDVQNLQHCWVFT